MSQYKYFKLNSSLSYKQYSFNLSLLGDPKFAEKGVRGARRWPGGMGPAKSRGPTDRETRGQGSVPKQVQKPSRCMSFRECSLRCRRTACACVCSRLSLSGHREGGGRGDGVHNQRGGTLEPFFFSSEPTPCSGLELYQVTINEAGFSRASFSSSPSNPQAPCSGLELYQVPAPQSARHPRLEPEPLEPWPH